MDVIVHSTRWPAIVVCLLQHSIMASCMYLASNFNCLQSASNILLVINVQEVLPAVQMSYVRMTSWKLWAIVTVPWLSGFCGTYGANQWVNEKSSYAVCVHFGTLDLIRTAIQQVGIAASVYHEDCGNIARRSCSDWNDAPTGLLLSGCFARRASSRWVGEI